MINGCEHFLKTICIFIYDVIYKCEIKKGCCDVVLDREEFFNGTTLKDKKTSSEAPIIYGPQLYRKSLNLYTGEISTFSQRKKTACKLS